MADNGIRGLAPHVATPGTSMATVFTVPSGKEHTVTMMRATNVGASDATVTVAIGGGEVAFNAPVKVGASVNILGPDYAVLPPGTVVQARASAASTIKLVTFRSERDL